MTHQTLDTLFQKTIQHKDIHEAALLIVKRSGEVIYEGMHNKNLDTPMLLASITKLWTTACIFKACEAGLIRLDDRVNDRLDQAFVHYGLFDDRLTIKALLYHQSGAGDYYLDAPIRLFRQALTEDLSFSPLDEFTWTKTLKRKKQHPKKGYYADINFTALGLILERVYVKPLKEIYDMLIHHPLALKNTHLAAKDTLIPHTFHGSKRFERPCFIQSCFASGGVVSTLHDLHRFMVAFFEGDLFSSSWLKDTHRVRLQLGFYPIRYALGFMAIPVSVPFQKTLWLEGHAGSTGSFAYYCAAKDVYVLGDLTQINAPARPVRFAMKSVYKV